MWQLPFDVPFDTSDAGKLPITYKPSAQHLAIPKNQSVSYTDISLLRLLNVPIKDYGTIKTLFAFRDTLLMASSNGAFTFHLPDLRLIDTLLYQRTTCAQLDGSAYFIGTLGGLYRVQNDSTTFMGDTFPVLSNHISALAKDSNGTLWIGTYDNGVVAYKNGHITMHLRKENGSLKSNICRCLYADGHNLWIGTEKGIHKMIPSADGYRLAAYYTASDGLASDIINTIYAKGSKVFAGTSAGLTCFDEQSVSIHAPCHILMTGVSVGGLPVTNTGNTLILPHASRDIRFEYAGLSFRSIGDIQYRYRLSGLNDNWQTTRETFLNYPTLPSGSYILQVQAINRFGDKSALLEKHFEVKKTFLEYTWVQVVAILIIAGLVWIGVQLRLNAVRKKEKQEQLVQKRMIELEQAGLRAQMNPHFIFNCLNSIQHFILERDVKGANFYLSRFAGLIRQTLDYASQPSVPLSEEISYLTHYLELEQMQMANSFTYSLTLAPAIDSQKVRLPVMIIQPFVENAIKHGVSKTKTTGNITLTFDMPAPDMLACTLTDNGPGIMRNVSQRHERIHISKGLSITADRIRLWNQLYAGEQLITIATDWAYDINTPEPYGTKIIFHFPLSQA